MHEMNNSKNPKKSLLFLGSLSLLLFVFTFFYSRFDSLAMGDKGQKENDEIQGQEKVLSAEEESVQTENIENNQIEDTQNENSQEKLANEKNTDFQDEIYNTLKDNLKKYCDKKVNVAKCKKYLIEVKEASKKGSRFKNLYKKYHFEKKEKDENNVIKSSAEDKKNKSELVVTLNGKSNSYEIPASSGISVIDLMDLLEKDSSQNFSYVSSSGFVDKINGVGSLGNMSWMLYACNVSTCKLSSVGASDCKMDDWDKIEWRYVDWTAIDWNTW
jgi:hypothetical protein